MLIFWNPGTIDIEAVTTLGVNAKTSDSAIGYFGTGLKYAIATILRNGGAISIHDGKSNLHVFRSREKTIRDKKFQLIVCTTNNLEPVPLGFTTDLGKNWTLANAYRELWSNCMDEGGVVYENVNPHKGVKISVSGLDLVHMSKDEFILNKSKKSPIYADSSIEVYFGASSSLFYKGIKVKEVKKPFTFTYNILDQMTLSEDRVAVWDYQYEDIIKSWLEKAKLPELQLTMVTEGNYEQQMGVSSYDSLVINRMTDLLAIAKGFPEKVNPNLQRALYSVAKAEFQTYEEIASTEAQLVLLAKVQVHLVEAFAIKPDLYPVKISSNLGQNVLGRADGKHIWLDPKVFESERSLLTAYYEEYIHNYYHLQDNSRLMQNFLFEKIADLILKD
jgi:hypothetical protein